MNYKRMIAAFLLIVGGMVAGAPVAIQTGIGIGVQSLSEAQNGQAAHASTADPED